MSDYFRALLMRHGDLRWEGDDPFAALGLPLDRKVGLEASALVRQPMAVHRPLPFAAQGRGSPEPADRLSAENASLPPAPPLPGAAAPAGQPALVGEGAAGRPRAGSIDDRPVPPVADPQRSPLGPAVLGSAGPALRDQAPPGTLASGPPSFGPWSPGPSAPTDAPLRERGAAVAPPFEETPPGAAAKLSLPAPEAQGWPGPLRPQQEPAVGPSPSRLATAARALSAATKNRSSPAADAGGSRLPPSVSPDLGQAGRTLSDPSGSPRPGEERPPPSLASLPGEAGPDIIAPSIPFFPPRGPGRPLNVLAAAVARRPAPAAAPVPPSATPSAGPEADEDVVRVTIARLDLQQAPGPPGAPRARPGRRVGLDDYLRRHRREGDR